MAEFLSTTSAKLKIVNLVFSIIAFGMMAEIFHFGSSEKEDRREFYVPELFSYKENFNLTILVIALIALLATMFGSFLNVEKTMARWKNIDAWIQVLVGVLLLMGWVMYLTEVKDFDISLNLRLDGLPLGYKEWRTKAICVLVFEAVEILFFSVTAFLAFIEK